MFDDLQNGIKNLSGDVKQRFQTPFTLFFISAFCFHNYGLFLWLFSNTETSDKILRVGANLYPSNLLLLPLKDAFILFIAWNIVSFLTGIIWEWKLSIQSGLTTSIRNRENVILISAHNSELHRIKSNLDVEKQGLQNELIAEKNRFISLQTLLTNEKNSLATTKSELEESQKKLHLSTENYRKLLEKNKADRHNFFSLAFRVAAELGSLQDGLFKSMRLSNSARQIIASKQQVQILKIKNKIDTDPNYSASPFKPDSIKDWDELHTILKKDFNIGRLIPVKNQNYCYVPVKGVPVNELFGFLILSGYDVIDMATQIQIEADINLSKSEIDELVSENS